MYRVTLTLYLVLFLFVCDGVFYYVTRFKVIACERFFHSRARVCTCILLSHSLHIMYEVTDPKQLVLDSFYQARGKIIETR
jgi:hypothetical protein